MTITNTNLGQNNNTGDEVGYQTIWADELIVAYESKSVTTGNHIEKDVVGGIGAGFHVTGPATAYYVDNTDAENATKLSAVPMLHKQVLLDQVMRASTAVAEIDELKSENAVAARMGISNAMVNSLVRAHDGNLLRTIAIGSALPVNFKSNLPTEDRYADTYRSIVEAGLVSPDQSVVKNSVFAAIDEASSRLDMLECSPEGRVLYVATKYKSALLNDPRLVSRDYDANGSVSKGMVGSYNGFKIVVTPNFPTTATEAVQNTALDVTINGVNRRSRYTFDNASKLAMLATHEMAVGTAKAMDLILEVVENDYRAQATLVGVKRAVGHDVLLPEHCIAIYHTALA